MKHLARILIAFAMVSGALLPAPSASAKSTRIDFTGIEWCDPDTFVVTREWMSGPNNYHSRGLSQTCYETATIPQMTGTVYLYNFRINAFDNFSQAQVSGEFRFVSVEGGEFLGTATSPRSFVTFMAIGHGVGIYQGLELHWFLDESGEQTVFWGYILDPGNGN